MYKKTLSTLVIAGTLVASPLFASNFFHKFTAAKNTKTNITSLKTTVKSGNFVDLSGNWEGSCDGDDFVETMTIKNTADNITIDGADFSIDSLETISSINSDYSFFSHFLLEWDQDNSKLLVNGSFVNYTPSHNPVIENSFGDVRGSFSLVGEQLVVEMNGHTSSGVSDTSICTYHRK